MAGGAAGISAKDNFNSGRYSNAIRDTCFAYFQAFFSVILKEGRKSLLDHHFFKGPVISKTLTSPRSTHDFFWFRIVFAVL